MDPTKFRVSLVCPCFADMAYGYGPTIEEARTVAERAFRKHHGRKRPVEEIVEHAVPDGDRPGAGSHYEVRGGRVMDFDRLQFEAEKRVMDFDRLQFEAEKLVALLKDRHPGIIGWSQSVVSQLNEICALGGVIEIDPRPTGMTKAVAETVRDQLTTPGYITRIVSDPKYVRGGGARGGGACWYVLHTKSMHPISSRLRFFSPVAAATYLAQRARGA